MRDQTFIIKGESQVIKISQNVEPVEKNMAEIKKIKYLQIPRKPTWQGKTLEEQKTEQNMAFLDWRKQLGSLQDNFPDAVLTPYEKNFEVWKQLWYVVEKSDLLVQIIDCRDPLFYHSDDLENYVRESHKNNFLLINKADLVPESIRKSISEYLKSQNRSHVFFSAKLEQEILDVEEVKEGESKVKEVPKYDLEFFRNKLNTETMFGRDDLIHFFEFFAQNKLKINLANLNIDLENNESLVDPIAPVNPPVKNIATIGMVGYPNVGKSSVINALCGKKKVGVDSKPGKTKNLQTIILSPNITLCDCPGLIFPSLVNSKAEMICNGVISIDAVMEYVEPINYILQTVPNLILKYLYKLPLHYETSSTDHINVQYKNQFKGLDFKDLLEDQNMTPLKDDVIQEEHRMTARGLLQLFAGTRGFVNGAGLPDEAKASRIIIKDYIEGKVPHFKIPEHNEFIRDIEFEKILVDLKENLKHFMIIRGVKSEDLIINEHKIIEAKMNKDLEEMADIGAEGRHEKIEFLENLNEDDIVALIEGKMVGGVKLVKDERRELKHLVKSSPPVDKVIALLKNFMFKEESVVQVKGKKTK